MHLAKEFDHRKGFPYGKIRERDIEKEVLRHQHVQPEELSNLAKLSKSDVRLLVRVRSA